MRVGIKTWVVGLLWGAGMLYLWQPTVRPGNGAAQPTVKPVRVVAVDTLRDVALAVYDPSGSVIYYNPALMRRLGPRLSAFLMAHERGHIALHHTRANALMSGGSGSDSVLQAWELAADCFATARLQHRQFDAVEAALRFFTEMGSTRNDLVHPSGTTRADHIRACLGQAPPVEPAPVMVTFAMPPSGGRSPWQEIHVRVGTGPEFVVSNLRLTGMTIRQRLLAGIHEYQLDGESYALDPQMQLTPTGRITGRGRFEVRGNEVFQVVPGPSGHARLVDAADPSQGAEETAAAGAVRPHP